MQLTEKGGSAVSKNADESISDTNARHCGFPFAFLDTIRSGETRMGLVACSKPGQPYSQAAWRCQTITGTCSSTITVLHLLSLH